MIMKNMPYMFDLHYIVIAMRGVEFPVTKKEAIERVGGKQILTGPDTYTPFREILEKLPLDSFSCAAEFYCNLSAI